jgi:hypothetical protein
MIQPVPPFWFLQRQGKAEAVGDNTLRLTAPNLAETFLRVDRDDSGRFSASLRATADGPPLVTSDALYDREEDAWAAAFEMYRMHVVI